MKGERKNKENRKKHYTYMCVWLTCSSSATATDEVVSLSRPRVSFSTTVLSSDRCRFRRHSDNSAAWSSQWRLWKGAISKSGFNPPTLSVISFAIQRALSLFSVFPITRCFLSYSKISVRLLIGFFFFFNFWMQIFSPFFSNHGCNCYYSNSSAIDFVCICIAYIHFISHQHCTN